MKRLGWLALLALSQTAWAGSLQDCQQDAASAGCSAGASCSGAVPAQGCRSLFGSLCRWGLTR